MDEVVLTACRVMTGLLAGVYVAFLVAVMPALHGLGDDIFVAVMNRIDVVIVNPAFLTVFLGAPTLTIALLRWQHGALAIAAAALAVAALVVTVIGNLPLNDALAQGGLREAFETPWLVWHSLRTTAAVVSFALLCRVPIS